MTPAPIDVTVGTDISKSNNLRPAIISDVFQLAALVGKGTMHVSQLNSSLSTREDWLSLPKSLKKDEPGLSRDRLKVRGRYLLAGFINGQHRDVASVVSVGLLIVDQDEGDLSEAEIRQKVGRHCAVFFETANSTPSARRWRIIFLLVTPLGPDDYREAVKAFALSWGAALDACSSRPAQPQLLPFEFDDYSPQVFVHEGERLALHEYLAGGGSVLPGKALVADDDRAAQALANYRAPVDGIPRDRIEQALATLDSSERTQWVRVGMMLKHQYQNDDEEGFEIFDEWSQLSPEKYDPAQARREWGTFKANPIGRPPVTLTTIFPEARKWAVTIQAVDERAVLANEISMCDDEARLRDDICPRLMLMPGYDEYADKFFCAEVRRWFKTRHKPEPTDKIVRSWMMPKPLTYEPTDEEKERWKDWVFVQATDTFVNVSTKRRASSMGFNAEFNNEFMHGGKLSCPASVYVINRKLVEVVSNLLYLPGHDVTPTIDGVKYLNTWRSDSVPKAIPRKQWSNDLGDRRAIRSILRLMNRLFDLRERKLLIEWASWMVRNEKDHPNWSPLIQGPQGVGKTLLGEVLSAALGKGNTKIVDPHVLSTGFTSWAEGAKLAVIEEVRLPGEKGTAHSVVNALKPYITNDTISIHRKGVDPFNAPNVTGYLMLTNHEDALPIEKGDRRHFIVFTKLRTEDDARALEERHPTIFTDVVTAAQHYGEVIRGALMHEVPRMKPSPDFQPKGRAPNTEAKMIMRDFGRPEDETLITELLAEKFEGCNPKGVVSTKHLRDRLARVAPRLHFRTARAGLMLRNAGYEKFGGGGGKLKWRNEALNIWVRVGSGLNDKRHSLTIQQLLDETVGSEFGDDDADND